MKREELAVALLKELGVQPDNDNLEAVQASFNEIVDAYWMAHYINHNHGLCGLCGNTGVIDTTETAISPAGVNSGKKHFCMCPNGQQLRKAGYDVEQTYKPGN